MIKKIGQTIKEIRKIRGISAAQLAEFCEVSPAAVSRWENGHNIPRLKYFESIISFLRVPESLFDDWIPESHFSSMTEKELDQLCKKYIKKENSRGRAVWNFLYKDNSQLGEIYKSIVQLNSAGKTEAVKRVKELTELPRYRAKEK